MTLSIKTQVEQVHVELAELYAKLRKLRSQCRHDDHVTRYENTESVEHYKDLECLDCGFRWRSWGDS